MNDPIIPEVATYKESTSPGKRKNWLLIILGVSCAVLGAVAVFLTTNILQHTKTFSEVNDTNAIPTIRPLPAGIPSDWFVHDDIRCGVLWSRPQQIPDQNGFEWLTIGGNQTWLLFTQTAFTTFTKMNSDERETTIIRVFCNENSNKLTTNTLLPALMEATKRTTTPMYPYQYQSISNPIDIELWGNTVKKASVSNKEGLSKDMYFFATPSYIYGVELVLKASDSAEIQQTAQTIFDNLQFN